MDCFLRGNLQLKSASTNISLHVCVGGVESQNPLSWLTLLGCCWVASPLLFGSCHSREETTLNSKEQPVPKWEKMVQLTKLFSPRNSHRTWTVAPTSLLIWRVSGDSMASWFSLTSATASFQMVSGKGDSEHRFTASLVPIKGTLSTASPMHSDKGP